MIIVQVEGGLGNQLFQYAAGRRLADLKKVPLKLDTQEFITDHKRPYQLQHFNITAEVATLAEIERYPKPYLWKRLWRGLYRRFMPFPLRHYYKEAKLYHYDTRFVDLPMHVYLQGFFQNEAYFKPIETLIRREFTLITTLDDANHKMTDQIRSVNAVALHIRRGDYAHNAHIHAFFGLMPLDYYHAAVKKIREKVTQPHFFVFSDDQEWAQANLRLEFPMTFVDLNHGERDYADLYLMSQCQHHIIANSSFSWWGAWLGEHAAQVVCAPHQWLTDSKYEAYKIIPDRWLQN